MQGDYQDNLKREVEKIYGKKIGAYADCVLLTKDILTKTGLQINVNTIRRFFGVVQAEYPPSLTTLEIISQYAGYRSFEHFVEFKKHHDSPISQPSLFLDYVTILFDRVGQTTFTDPTWLGIVRETIQYFERAPQEIDRFQYMIARTRIGLDIYFEQFVNMDQLNGYYGDGIRYYLAAKDTKEAQLFGHSLMVLRYFLVEDFAALATHYEKVMKIKVEKHFHPFVCGRYFATQLLYHRNNHEKLYQLARQARQFYSGLPPSRDVYQSFPCFELIITEALILTGQMLEALFYIQESRKKTTDYQPPAVDVKLFNALYVFEAFAYASLGEIEKAKKTLGKLKLQDFYFLSKRYLMILYNITTFQIRKERNVELGELLEKGVAETGFVALGSLLTEM